MAVTPRRSVEVLTHRGGVNRRIGDIETDCCIEREDDDDDTKKNLCYQFENSLQHHPTVPISSSPSRKQTNTQSHGSLGDTQQKARRRQRGDQKTWMLAGIVGVAILVCTLFIAFFPTDLSDPRISRKATERPQFELSSFHAPTSCTESLEEHEIEFTLATQVSSDRLWMVEHHCNRWKLDNENFYPISIAVLTNETPEHVQQTLQKYGCHMDLLTVQVLPASLYPRDDYPVNTLRNIALRGVKTSHVLYVDVDFWISQELASSLQYPEVTQLLASDPKATLVIPAFQLDRQCQEWRECSEQNIPQMPHNLTELKEQILNKEVTRFDPTNRGGHGTTKYKEWLRQNREDGVVLVEIDCFLSNRYEPYLVFRYCKELPPFQESFSGYGKNKMTWVMQLRRMGYTFWQLGKGAFVVHYPHLDSPSRVAWNYAPIRRNDPFIHWQAYKRGQMDQLFVEFRLWLYSMVPDLTRTPFCQEKLNDDARLLYDRKAFNKSLHTGSHLLSS